MNETTHRRYALCAKIKRAQALKCADDAARELNAARADLERSRRLELDERARLQQRLGQGAPAAWHAVACHVTTLRGRERDLLERAIEVKDRAFQSTQERLAESERRHRSAEKMGEQLKRARAARRQVATRRHLEELISRGA